VKVLRYGAIVCCGLILLSAFKEKIWKFEMKYEGSTLRRVHHIFFLLDCLIPWSYCRTSKNAIPRDGRRKCCSNRVATELYLFQWRNRKISRKPLEIRIMVVATIFGFGSQLRKGKVLAPLTFVVLNGNLLVKFAVWMLVNVVCFLPYYFFISCCIIYAMWFILLLCWVIYGFWHMLWDKLRTRALRRT
jgi:hypothetical protein